MSTTRLGSVPALTGFSTAESRWARLGPYYAMFPVDFAREVVDAFSQPGDTVLDPFCGRGTAPYVAMISGRQAAGCDINPVAWLYAVVKTRPHPSLADVARRIDEINSATYRRDRQPDNEFQAFAYGPRALGFINAARRELQWQEGSLDRTIAALLIHYLHAKLGGGLSNQMRPSKAMSPDYSIRWWRQRGLTTPPDVDPAAFLRDRAAWRYAKGVPKNAGSAWVTLGDAATVLTKMPATADLILTSPPYIGVTNYQLDNWLRLWALGEGPPLPDWSTAQKFRSHKKYEAMLVGVLKAACDRSRDDTVWWLRVDARPRTLTVARRVMEDLLPGHLPHERPSLPARHTQTSLYGDYGTKPGDIDLVYLPPEFDRPDILRRFQLAQRGSDQMSKTDDSTCDDIEAELSRL